MTANQLKLLGMARSWAAKSIPNFDDTQFRTVLRSIGGLSGEDRPSSKSLTNRGFEEVMAWFESVGFRYESHHRGHGVHRGEFPNSSVSSESSVVKQNYWNDKASRSSRNQITDRQIRMIELLASQQTYAMEGMILRMTAHRKHDLLELTSREAYDLTEALKQIIERGTPAMFSTAAQITENPLRGSAPPRETSSSDGGITQDIPF